MTELKKCPFCGGRAFLERSGAILKGETYMVAYVRCSVCFARTGRMRYADSDMDGRQKAKQDAVTAWNMRCE
jgi:Lar family restriction alleviation protein